MKRKLLSEQVTWARSQYKKGIPLSVVAAELSLGVAPTRDAIFGATYKDVPGALNTKDRRVFSGTSPFNTKTAVGKFVDPVGSGNPNAVLDEVKVSYIKAHLKLGVARILLMKYFKVSKAQIHRIARGMQWKHVEPHPNPPPLIFSPERELPIRLRGKRLEQAFEQMRAK